MDPRLQFIQKAGDILVDLFHYLALFCIGSTMVWSAIGVLSLAILVQSFTAKKYGCPEEGRDVHQPI